MPETTLPAPMAGVLHRYGPLPHQLAFVSSPPPPPPPQADAGAADAAPSPPTSSSSPPQTAPPSPPNLHTVLLSGLTEGLLALPYAPLLAERCAAASFSLVQAQLRSSYDGWGSSSLDGDADELLLLMRWLGDHLGSEGIVVVGHSTGCQIACRLCERHHDVLLEAEAEAAAATTAAAARGSPPPPPLLGVCLQAPVSDREYFFAAEPEAAARQLRAAREALAEGDPGRVVAVVEGSPLCARRAAALLERLGDDDMFSRDLSEEDLKGRTSLGWVSGHGGGVAGAGADGGGGGAEKPAATAAPGGRPVLVLASGADEYALPLLPPAPPSEGKGVEGAPPPLRLAAAKKKLDLIRADAERLAAAAGQGAVPRTLEGAPHNGGAGKESEVVDAIAELLLRSREVLVALRGGPLPT